MSATPEAVPSPKKPRISYFFATACGLGYLKPGPGTWGSLAGVGISIALTYRDMDFRPHYRGGNPIWDLGFGFWARSFSPGISQLVAVLIVAAVGVYVAGKVERHYAKSDPQFVVIDEVSGQLFALSFPFTALNWKSWLLGFILFRVFDIWKPFPARQAESLHGGWGIMADDWVAGIYAGLVLWAVQATGILK
jgi:phosphatidylglycerophosphatase A